MRMGVFVNINLRLRVNIFTSIKKKKGHTTHLLRVIVSNFEFL